MAGWVSSWLWNRIKLKYIRSATVWLDNGNDLMEGPAGPWSSNFLGSQSWKTSINPTILHRPRIALKTSCIAPQSSRQHRSQGKFPQSASLLRSHYERFLNRETSIGDPFYALSEVMTFVASSESQFLNMIEQKIVAETERSLNAGELADKEDSHISTLSNLTYNKKVIDEHIRRFKENITSLARRGNPRWPKATEGKQITKATESATTLLKDYEYLLEKAETLSKSCDRGMDMARNNVMVAESYRSFQQARHVSKLTFLAFLYLPASFSTSFFGMNFKQFGTGSKKHLEPIRAIGSNLYIFPATAVL